jgi:hypothetical protein
MSSNDQIILDQVLAQTQSALAPELAKDRFFELFASEQVVKEYDLTYEDIQAGIVDGPLDGGVDALYVFVNGDLVQEDSELTGVKKGVELELVVVQATTSPGFSEARIDCLVATFEELLDLAVDLATVSARYNEGVRTGIGVFRSTYKELAARFPMVRVRFGIASRATEVHPNVAHRANRLTGAISKHISVADCQVAFLKAGDLLELARRRPNTTYSLVLAESPISSAGQVGFVCLVKLTDYFDFITEQGHLQRHLFEANVRDYQGSTEVNQDIRRTLSQTADEDFWWLNNGVTIVASKAVQSGKALTIEDPQIVNGLQTSNELYKHFQQGDKNQEGRTLLVRVIVPKGPASRDRIIKATNSQTAIPAASLRATDRIHRDIEELLKPMGYFYDRRKNAHKNAGVPVEKIIGIPYMAQAIMGIALQRPDNARSRPSSLLKRDEDYKQVFSISKPLGAYVNCAVLTKKVESHLRSGADMTVAEKGNIRFHVAMAVAMLACKSHRPSFASLAALDVIGIHEEVLDHACELVLNEFRKLGGSDSVAKSADFVTAIRQRLDATPRAAENRDA